jgi:starch synthase
MRPVRVLSVASEIYPIIKTGGLADVTGALPIALKAEGIETRTLLPGYPAAINALEKAEQRLAWRDFFGGPARLLSGSSGALDLFVLDAPHLFGRPGNPYLSPEGVDWPDNGLRFAALAGTAADIGLGGIPSFVPDVVHSHDWQAGLTPAYLHYSGQPHPGTIMTVHNLAFQGRFPRQMLGQIGLPPDSFTMHGVEYYGDIGFLKAGLQFADRITTVSPSYAVEIQGDDGGMGLGGLLRARSGQLQGILNGIDIDVWNPATDRDIPDRFSPNDLDRRLANKAALQQRFGLRANDEAVLLGVISRLSWQKGLDLLIECIPTLLNEGMQLAVLGSGDAELENKFRAAAKANPGQIGVSVGYDEALAHLIQAGADALVVPSRFEPCGLTQLCALRYGAVPIVSRVGGLEDTVRDFDETGSDHATGFKFEPVTTERLAAALRRAHTLFRDKPAWKKMQMNGMSTDVSWRSRAGQYARLYNEIAGISRG